MNQIDLQRFNDEGYVLIPGVIDAKTVQELRRMCLDAFEQQKTAVLFDGVIHYPQMYQLLKSPKLVDALCAILGKPFAVPPHSSAMHNGFGYFHTDTSAAEIDGWTFHQRPEYRMVTVAIYLQDNDEYGGGIRLVPRSHRESDIYVEMIKQKHVIRDKLKRSWIRRVIKRLSRDKIFDWRKAFEDDPRSVDIPSKIGDVIIWDMRIIHRASPQTKKGSRYLGGKVGIFFTAGANNSITTKDYIDYVNSNPANAAVKKTREQPEFSPPPPTDEFFIL